jgi:tetratricopeptide (TPR) repeat protein
MHALEGNFAQAYVAFELARQLADRNQHPARVADALRNLGIDARLHQRYAQAIDYFRAARAIAEKIGKCPGALSRDAKKERPPNDGLSPLTIVDSSF